jgi:hypothetical protein
VLALSNNAFAWLFVLAVAWNAVLWPILFVRARRRDAETDASHPGEREPDVRWVGGARVRRGWGSGSASWPLAVLEGTDDVVHLKGRGLARIAIPSTWLERSAIRRVSVSRGVPGGVVKFVPESGKRYLAKFYTTSLGEARAIGRHLLDNGWPVDGC